MINSPVEQSYVCAAFSKLRNYMFWKIIILTLLSYNRGSQFRRQGTTIYDVKKSLFTVGVTLLNWQVFTHTQVHFCVLKVKNHLYYMLAYILNFSIKFKALQRWHFYLCLMWSYISTPPYVFMAWCLIN
jgi:hypothetical protein